LVGYLLLVLVTSPETDFSEMMMLMMMMGTRWDSRLRISDRLRMDEVLKLMMRLMTILMMILMTDELLLSRVSGEEGQRVSIATQLEQEKISFAFSWSRRLVWSGLVWSSCCYQCDAN
jgi:hypothetical protein